MSNDKPKYAPVFREEEVLAIKRGGLNAPYIFHTPSGYYADAEELRRWREWRSTTTSKSESP